MPVEICNGGCLKLTDNGKTLYPTTEEIYSAVFEGADTIRGIGVTKELFISSGIEFQRNAAEPQIVLEMGEGRLLCKLKARHGSSDCDLAHDGSDYFEYMIYNNCWYPLPIGTVTEAKRILATAAVEGFGEISLKQYMRLSRQDERSMMVVDKTANAMSASAISQKLDGAPPAKLHAKLYPYQLDGYRWLSFMAGGGLGSIIADEMGLGKTIQVICLLLEMADKGSGPCLVISPATLLPNWLREIGRFAPTLKSLVHRGARRTGLSRELKEYDVIISSYETVVADIAMFRSICWPLVVVDEAQGIKNPASKRARQLKTLPRDSAVAISGTPVENRLADLWSITDFVMPSLLGTLPEYEKRHPDTLAGAALLEPQVSPLILRRTVNQVAKDLPERIDMPQPLEMDEASISEYEEIRSEAEVCGVGAGLASLMRLRMYCTHPWLVEKHRSVEAIECSVKFRRLCEILEEISDNGGKAIVFTSYQESIDILVAEIKNTFGIPADAIDGRVPVMQRQDKVDAFSKVRSSAVLVLNPKAAGTGLNITAANHVIHYNPEWNPAVEDQASARVYRRGQTRPVTVHQLYYVNTVEEVMIDRMRRKRELASVAVAGTDGKHEEIDDLLKALRISPARAGKG